MPDPQSEDKLIIRCLGKVPYEPIWQEMKQFTQNRVQETVDEFWVLEHLPVFTQGQAGKAEHLLSTGEIPVIQVDRGGQVTYHGPGQLVIYLLINLQRKKIGVRALVDAIENSLVALLLGYGIYAETKPDAPGVYVQGAKIASLGLRVRKGCSFHGLSLNVDMELAPFLRINPCGYSGLCMTQMTQEVADQTINLPTIARQLWEILAQRLDYREILIG
jgi:lipoyl(octanoyl) transferase